MTLLKGTRREVFSTAIIISVFILGQVMGSSINNVKADEFSFDVTSDDLIFKLNEATNSIATLFNEREGIFIWNMQNPENLSRYGDFCDLTNGDESLLGLDYKTWLEGLSQDISIQYLLLKNYVDISMQYIDNQIENQMFYRDWMFLTERIINTIYVKIANSDSLMNILRLLSNNGDILGEFWNALIRPKYNSFIEQEVALLPDTLVLGSKILRAVEFMPDYFSPWEEMRFKTLTEIVSDWWYVINRYALYDPDFTIAGLGTSRFHSENYLWTNWTAFKRMMKDESFDALNIFTEDHLELQRYIFTAPKIASQYLSYIEKISIKHSYLWNPEAIQLIPIVDENLLNISQKIIQEYAMHISHVRNRPLYVFDPREETASWTPLPELFSGYTYYWPEYFLENQGSQLSDLYQYRTENSPLKLTQARTYQGAGDIRGLMEIFNVLTYGFEYQTKASDAEKAALNILIEILEGQRIDSSYVLSPYFGTNINEEIFPTLLFNDAELLYQKYYL